MTTAPPQRPHLLLWVGALVALVAGLAVLLVCLDAPGAQNTRIQRLSSAEFQLAPLDSTAPIEAAWQPVTLPDNWSRQRKDAQGIGWYRLKFDLPPDTTPQQDLSLHVKRLSMAGEFYLNGHLLAPAMQVTESVLRLWNTPQYRALPRNWLQAGANEIQVRLFAYRDYNGGLSALELGPNAAVYPSYTRSFFLHSTLTAAAIVVLLVIGVLALAIGLRFARDGSPFFLGLCSMAWAARLLNNYVQVIPVDWFWWGWIIHSLSGWVPLFMLLYCHRYLGIQRKGLEHAMLGYTALCTVLMGAYMAAWIGKVTMAVLWLPFTLLTSAYLLTILWRLLHRSVGATPFLLAVALAFFLLGELHDRMISAATLEPWIGFEAAYWRPVSAMLLAVAFCLLVADEFVRAINEAKRSAVEQERALGLERERMNREMHDGLGAHLITALRGVERGALSKEQVAQLLQDGLDELRLLMDTSDLGRSLHAALAAWRNHWDARLQAVGVNLSWQVDTALEHLALSSDATLHVMRVLQEAVTNTVKHAQASEIAVRAQQQDQHLVLEIVDNGVGLSAVHSPNRANPHHGRGLSNMQQRAERLGAHLQLEALQAPRQGTRVCLTLPWVEPA